MKIQIFRDFLENLQIFRGGFFGDHPGGGAGQEGKGCDQGASPKNPPRGRAHLARSGAQKSRSPHGGARGGRSSETRKVAGGSKYRQKAGYLGTLNSRKSRSTLDFRFLRATPESVTKGFGSKPYSRGRYSLLEDRQDTRFSGPHFNNKNLQKFHFSVF